MIIEEEKLLTLEDVAEILGCSVRHVREVIIRNRKLPALTLHKKDLRVTPADLREWICKARRGLV